MEVTILTAETIHGNTVCAEPSKINIGLSYLFVKLTGDYSQKETGAQSFTPCAPHQIG
jgi:hypothetical protein